MVVISIALYCNNTEGYASIVLTVLVAVVGLTGPLGLCGPAGPSPGESLLLERRLPVACLPHCVLFLAYGAGRLTPGTPWGRSPAGRRS